MSAFAFVFFLRAHYTGIVFDPVWLVHDRRMGDRRANPSSERKASRRRASTFGDAATNLRLLPSMRAALPDVRHIEEGRGREGVGGRMGVSVRSPRGESITGR